MMRIDIDTKSRKVLLGIRDIKKNTEKGIRHGFYLLGKELVRCASQDILRKPITGRVYKYKGRRHRASIAGEAPANRSGVLRRSLDFKVHGSDGMEFGYEADYGKYLEDEQIHNRPALLISIKKNERNAANYFEQEIKKELE